jgi:hypothetical protein
LIPYTGVIINNGKFFAQCKLPSKNVRKGPFEFLEDAARSYNSIVLEYDKNARINLVPDTRTNINNIYEKTNLSIEIIDSLYTIKELEAVFRINKDWRKKGNVVLSKMRVQDLEKYKNIAKNLISQE